MADIYTTFMSDLAQILVSEGISYPSDIKGFDEKSILWLEDGLERRLPRAFVSFLMTMGCGVGRWDEEDGFYIRPIEKYIWANNILERLISKNVPLYQSRGSVVCFANDQSITASFFYLSEDDDPFVFVYDEGVELNYPGIIDTKLRFTEFIEKHVETLLTREQIRRMRDGNVERHKVM